jgi:hypothetical protein
MGYIDEKRGKGLGDMIISYNENVEKEGKPIRNYVYFPNSRHFWKLGTDKASLLKQ